jgi:hypothetical protein
MEFTEQNVLALYDSVSLINELRAIESPTEEQTQTIEQNTKHLEIMMGKEDFVALLTEAQITEINQLITE